MFPSFGLSIPSVDVPTEEVDDVPTMVSAEKVECDGWGTSLIMEAKESSRQGFEYTDLKCFQKIARCPCFGIRDVMPW